MRTRGVTFILSVLLTAVLLAGCSGGEAITGENLEDYLPELLEQEVFTAEYAQENFYLWAFEGDTPRYKDVDGQLCMDIGQGGGLDKQWDPESFAVISEDDTAIDITVEYLNYGSVRTAALTLVKTEDGLRIDAMEG